MFVRFARRFPALSKTATLFVEGHVTNTCEVAGSTSIWPMTEHGRLVPGPATDAACTVGTATSCTRPTDATNDTAMSAIARLIITTPSVALQSPENSNFRLDGLLTSVTLG